MRAYPQTATASPPRVFTHSLDWRFLLPIADPQKVCLIYEEDAELSQTLERVGIHTAHQLSFADLRDRKHDSFPVMVLPFGLAIGQVGRRREDRIEFYLSVRRFIDSGGYLLVGFNNALNLHPKPQATYHPSTPLRIAEELKQAGFESVKIFGAMPNLKIPEYIFDRDSRTIQFALQNRFRRKPALLGFLRVLAGTVGWKRMSNLLPCYFAVGTA
jgi:hypothetical protein